MQMMTTDNLSKLQINQIIQLNRECALFSKDNYSYEPFYEYSGSDDDSGAEYYVLTYHSKDTVRLIGFASALVINQEAEITGIVHPDFRRQGLFSKMTKSIIRRLRSNGCSDIYASLPNIPDNKNLSLCSMFKGISHTEYLLIFHKDFLGRHPNENNLDINMPGHLKFTHTLSNTQNAVDGYCLRMKYVAPSGRIQWRSVSSSRLLEEGSFTNLWDVKTKKPYRNKGYGFQLIQHVISDYFKSNDKPLILNVSDRNAAAFALYKKCGFEVKDKIVYYTMK